MSDTHQQVSTRREFNRKRDVIIDEKGRECEHCGGTTESGAESIEIHHIIPIEDGGGNEMDNLAVLCNRCHRALHSEDRKAHPPALLEGIDVPPRHDGVVLTCDTCGNTWEYTGHHPRGAYTNCSNRECRYKVRIPEKDP